MSARRIAGLSAATAVALAALTFVCAIIAIWTGDGRWWQTCQALAVLAGLFAVVAVGSATFPGWN